MKLFAHCFYKGTLIVWIKREDLDRQAELE